MTTAYTDEQLDALREVANIGLGTGGTALSTLLGRPVDLTIPRALALPLREAIAATGPADQDVTVVTLAPGGELGGVAAMLVDQAHGERLVEMGDCELEEVGKVVGDAYLSGLSVLAGLEIAPSEARASSGALAPVLERALAGHAAEERVLLLNADLTVDDEECSLAFVLAPSANGASELLNRLGVGG